MGYSFKRLDKASEFYNRLTKLWLQDNDMGMHLTNSEGKSVVAERFITTYKYMTSVSTNVYSDKLDNIVNKYNNTYHRTIKMKPVDVTSNTYIHFNKENN